MSKPSIRVINAPAPRGLFFKDIPDGVFFRERGQTSVRMKFGDKQLWINGESGNVSLGGNFTSASDGRYVLVSVELHVVEVS